MSAPLGGGFLLGVTSSSLVGGLILGTASLNTSVASAPSVGDIILSVTLALAFLGGLWPLPLGVGLAPLFGGLFLWSCL